MKITKHTYEDLRIIRKRINSSYVDGRFNEAKELLETAFVMAKQSDQHPEDFRRELTKLCGMAGDILGELGDFNQSLQYYEKFQCLKMQLKTNLFKNSQPSETIKLYRFRKFTNYTLANLLNKEITLSKPSQMISWILWFTHGLIALVLVQHLSIKDTWLLIRNHSEIIGSLLFVQIIPTKTNMPSRIH